MIELAERTLADGSQTVITLFHRPAESDCLVSASNLHGTSTVAVSLTDAAQAYWHPFSRENWLTYPKAA